MLTLRMTLFFETPNARTISTWRQTPWQISWAVNIRKAAAVVLGVLEHRLSAAEVDPLAILTLRH